MLGYNKSTRPLGGHDVTSLNQKVRKCFRKSKRLAVVSMALKTKLKEQTEILQTIQQLEVIRQIDYPKQSNNLKDANDMLSIGIIGGLGFGLISMDVFNSSSAHMFAVLDTTVHTWVLQNCPEQVELFSDQVISNIPIGIGVLGCCFCSTNILLQRDRNSIRNLVALIPFFVLGFGYYDGHFKAGGVAANFLKTVFHRTRPSEFLHSFAYPSGHSSTATFMLGMFLIVLLPMITSSEYTSNRFVKFLLNNRYKLWLSGWAVTASGRLLADVHWASDVCAGLCLGMVLVSTAKISVNQFNFKFKQLVQRSSQSS
eukprot:TRINITY_DN7539_c0_g1_i1.p1 TRINITY_DN7539_c0_g1~~TRINITY_DN7539_c0_g1_i1.p1  ORF type:complete len:313 (-),score=4.62 TRINITY_DN7539_c0_g1_i1:1482-2420(-)